MRRRETREGRREGHRAARWNRMPGILSDDDEDLEEEDDPAGRLLAGTKTRVRRQYDERRDRDDAEGIEDVKSLSEILIFDSTYRFTLRRKYRSKTSVTSKRIPLPSGLQLRVSAAPSRNISTGSCSAMRMNTVLACTGSVSGLLERVSTVRDSITN